jgi:hypothetical protein
VSQRVPAIILALTTLLGVACGPELTNPADSNVSGTWHAAGPAAGLSNITMVLQQDAEGSITGTFTAIGTPSEQACPTTGVCSLASTVRGANTVLQVNLQLKGGGTFTGQLTTATRLHGTMTSLENALVDFDKAP